MHDHPITSEDAGHTHETVMTIGLTSVNAMALPAKGPNGEYHDHVWHAEIEDVIANGGVMPSSIDNDHAHSLAIPATAQLATMRRKMGR